MILNKGILHPFSFHLISPPDPPDEDSPFIIFPTSKRNLIKKKMKNQLSKEKGVYPHPSEEISFLLRMAKVS